jgi:CopA family copper-resistance protein
LNSQTGELTRRQFLRSAAAMAILTAFDGIAPAYGLSRTSGEAAETMHHVADAIELTIGKKTITIGEREGTAITVNGAVPGPLLRFREGRTVTLRVTNLLKEHTSVHWHGLILPAPMDGVPGVSFPGIEPGETFTYRYAVNQSGTYWYHSHSMLQEQLGHYGPLIIDPAEPEPFDYDREHVVMLSDWTFENPYRVLSKLKKQSDYYNFQQRTLPDFFRDVSAEGWRKALCNRLAWARMRMDPTDISDITGYTYTYLVNGLPPEANWTALFRPGERVRLRFINGSAMTYFNIRIPGLDMVVVQSDGQNVEPFRVHEFQIATAETYDVIVEPKEDKAYTIFAESMDRSGFARCTLAVREGMSAPVPELRPRPILSMADMGMAGMDMCSDSPATGHGEAMAHGGQHAGHGGSHEEMMTHGPDHHGPANAMIAMMPQSRLAEPGTGLENVGHRVLAYTDLRNLRPGDDQRAPQREIEMHLTGNMERYMWSIDGKKFSEAEPVPLEYGERVRFVLVNDTMMNHPFHLHGMWMELENGAGPHRPRKHTINVKPGERLSFLVTADAAGNWAFHCHLVYHMHLGMFRVITVRKRGEGEG